MAVITQFVVVREGVEKMTFTSKKDADAYDKMLDIADNLQPLLAEAALDIDDATCESLSFYLAKHRDEFMKVLKGGSSTKEEPVTVKSPGTKKRTMKKASEEVA
ncbi:YebG family protein [Shewanella surugensis]|uniref:YebG family protein n=1 Tax=Shewanella surugensis TaxID=212020 RepID=A0ABT0LBI3_9GAMM|nr:YebG family protein [Shewanella surugensis]MCL1124929.1 YebG family protein [Shewanella surugensis]